MGLPSEEAATKASTTAAKSLVDTYYIALNNTRQRSTLSSFYIQPTPASPLAPDISLNGNLVPSVADLQKLWETQMPKALYEVQDYDCHVVNPDYNIGVPDGMLEADDKGRKCSILVVTSGYVKYGDPKDAKMRGFTENFILVPNHNAGPGEKKWLIQSQNFRMVL